MNKIYMAGVGGMLGEAFYKIFSKEYELFCTDININESWLNYCDFRDLDSYKKSILNFKPDYIFHIGAHTDLEFCEKNIDDCYLTNTIAVENACYLANILDVPIIYISTAGIFDGKKDLYDDYDLPNPICHYARSKYLGEKHVLNTTKKHIICRAGWMMGGGPNKDKKFINKIMNQLKNNVKELNIVSDKLGTPTLTYDFAENTKFLLEKELWGLYNMVCGGETSRYEIGLEIIRHYNLEDKVKINKVSSEFFADIYYAPRPPSERLINKKLNLRKINYMRDWKICLHEYLYQYYKI